MAVVWMIVGSLMVIVPYLVFDSPTDPWPPIIAGGVGGMLFTIVFVFYVLWKTPFSKFAKAISVVVFLIVVIGTVISWNTMYKMCHLQQSLLVSIRTSIGYSILQDRAYGLLLPPLRTYHELKTPKKSSIGNMFLAMDKDQIHGGYCSVLNEPRFFDIRPHVTDSTVTLAMVDSVAHGYNHDYANSNGLKGRLQLFAVLTEKGVRFERKN